MSEKAIAVPLAAQPSSKLTRWIVLLWIVAAVSLGGMALASPLGWDVPPIWKAIQAVGHGDSPYADGIAALEAYTPHSSYRGDNHPPLTFWYQPLTIPVLRLLSRFPGWLLGPLFGVALAAGFLLQLWAGYEMASKREQRWLIFLLPFVVFFPCLLCDISILSGNVAYILNGLILAVAIPGWKRNKWLYFYVAVVAASLCKPPLLTFLAFPVLVGRRQWLPACMTGAAGWLLFAVQPFLWPARFKEFLLIVHLHFYNAHDFGLAPSGVLGNWLWQMNKPNSSATTIAYLVWAIALGASLLAMSRYILRNPHLREMWIPIALMGTILLNPRIKPYDTAALTIPMILIAWRILQLVQKLAERQKVQCASGSVHSTTTPVPLQSLFRERPNLLPISVGVSWLAVAIVIQLIWGDLEAMGLPVLLLVLALGLWSLCGYADRDCSEI